MLRDMVFGFGGAERERVEIEVHGYERGRRVGEFTDDNWLNVTIRVQAGGFQGKVRACILTEELTNFLKQLEPLAQRSNGTAELSTMEEQLSLRLVGNGKGGIELQGIVADQAGIGNRLHFTLQLDQSQLGATCAELKKVISAFPVRGE